MQAQQPSRHAFARTEDQCGKAERALPNFLQVTTTKHWPSSMAGTGTYEFKSCTVAHACHVKALPPQGQRQKGYTAACADAGRTRRRRLARSYLRAPQHQRSACAVQSRPAEWAPSVRLLQGGWEAAEQPAPLLVRRDRQQEWRAAGPEPGRVAAAGRQ